MKTNKLPYLLPIRCILFPLIFVSISLITGKNLNQISNLWSIVATIVNFVIIFLLWAIPKRQGSSYAQLIHYEKGKTKIGQTIGMTGIILLAGVGGMYLAGFLCYGLFPYAPPMMIAPIPLWIAIINVLILPITISLAEDGLYLGCGVNQIQNKYVAILVPAFFYALQHCFIPTIWDVEFILYRFLSFLPLAVFLCWNYYKKRNPVPIMIGHAVIDIATVAEILVMSAVPGLYEKMCGM